MNFIIDFDNTLSDNDRVRVMLLPAIEMVVGATEANSFWSNNNMFSDHDTLVEFPFNTRKMFGNEVAVKIFENINMHGCLHEKASEVVSKLSQLGNVYIFTEGDEEFQSAKVRNCSLLENTKELFVFDRKIPHFKEVLMKTGNKNVFYIDDRTYNLEQAKKQSPEIKTIWIRQGFYKNVMAENGSVIDVTFNSIKELETYAFK